MDNSIVNEVKNKNDHLIKVNDYNIICILGKGQFGSVYLVEKDDDNDNDKKTRYAIKLLKRQVKKAKRQNNGRGLVANNDEDLIMNEVQIMQSLNHPHIVNLIAFINDPTSSSNNVYLVLDYVDGGPVMIVKGETEYGTPKFVCPVEGTVLGESRSCSLAAQIFDAMTYLHSHKIAHRDIKMDNILLDLDGNIRVADFGVSHSFEGITEEINSSTSRTSFKAFCKDTAGTFSFWSPEILEDKDEGYDAFAADVWAVGIVVYVFLFGELPYHSLDADSLFESISKGVPVLPSRKSPECVDILHKMLTRNADDRITFNDLLNHVWIVQHEKPIDDIKVLEPTSDESNNDANVFKKIATNKQLLKWERSASKHVLERRTSLRIEKESMIKKQSEKLKADDDDLTPTVDNSLDATEVVISVNEDHVRENQNTKNACCIIS